MNRSTFEAVQEIAEYMRYQMECMIPLPVNEEFDQVMEEYWQKTSSFREFLSGLEEENQRLIEEYLEIYGEKYMIEDDWSYMQGFVDGLRLMNGMGALKRGEEVDEWELRGFLEEVLEEVSA